MREGKITLGDLTQTRNKHSVQSYSLSTERKCQAGKCRSRCKGAQCPLSKAHCWKTEVLSPGCPVGPLGGLEEATDAQGPSSRDFGFTVLRRANTWEFLTSFPGNSNVELVLRITTVNDERYQKVLALPMI